MSHNETVTTIAKPKRRIRPNRLQKPDRRTREAKLIAEVTAELTQHVGGKPSAPQRELIELAVNSKLDLYRLAKQADADGAVGLRLLREQTAARNLYSRILIALGPKVEPERPSALHDLIGGGS